MRAGELECVFEAGARLGEGPLWHPGEGVLYWIDILRPAIYRYSPGSGQTGMWPMPSAVGAIGLWSNGLVVGLEHEAICLFDPVTGKLMPFADPAGVCDMPDVTGRYNDGEVDRLGNFWVGWLTHDRKQPGGLFRITATGECSRVLDDPVAPNGLGWSHNGRTMYVTDSHINTIWAYECDLEAGTLGRRRVLAAKERDLGIFDGLCVDAEGNIWTALYGGGAVLQLGEQGQELTRIEVPVRLATSCALGGTDLKKLHITSAVRDQSATELRNQPLAGSLFTVEVPVAGLPAHIFGYRRPASAP